METKVYLLEDGNDCSNNQVYSTLGAAAREALKRIKGMAKDEADEIELMKELMQTLVNSNFKSFYLDDCFWCYEISYFSE